MINYIYSSYDILCLTFCSCGSRTNAKQWRQWDFPSINHLELKCHICTFWLVFVYIFVRLWQLYPGVSIQWIWVSHQPHQPQPQRHTTTQRWECVCGCVMCFCVLFLNCLSEWLLLCCFYIAFEHIVYFILNLYSVNYYFPYFCIVSLKYQVN